MNKVTDIKNILEKVYLPQSGYVLRECCGYYWGRGCSGELVFGFPTKNQNINTLNQSTRHLKLYINDDFDVDIKGVLDNRKMTLLILKSTSNKHSDMFIRVILSMLDNLNEEILLKHFLELKDLFSNDEKMSKDELEGKFGELFSMYMLKINYGIDICTYYQKEDRRKFDFNLSDKKKIEVKTTIKTERIHHFLQQQLDTDRYDIRVISIMLQKDDAGMSLLNLIDECKDLFSNYFPLVIHIERILKSIDEEELDNLKFNYEYAKDHLKIYDALKLPRLKEKDIEGVFNVEYDVDFINSSHESIGKFAEWLKK